MQTDALRQSRRRRIVRPIGRNKRHTSFLKEVRNVDVVTGKPFGVRPWTSRRAALPSARVEKNDIARRDLHALHFFQRLEIFPMNRGTWLQPTLRGSLPRQTRRVEQDTTRDHAILQCVDAAPWTTSRGLDFLHRDAVVSPAVNHDVTIQCVKVAMNDAMIGSAVLISVQTHSRAYRNERTLQYGWSVHSLLLNDVVRQGDRDSFFHQCGRLLALRRGDEVRCAEFVLFSPASPV